MAFVSEIMPEEEKDKLPFFVSTRRDGSKPTLYKWLIDRERNAFVVLTEILGGAPINTNPVHYYVLSWNGHLVRFLADPELYTKDPEGDAVRWRVHDWDVPRELRGSKNELREMIEEALDAKGFVHNRNRFVEVQVEFDGCF